MFLLSSLFLQVPANAILSVHMVQAATPTLDNVFVNRVLVVSDVTDVNLVTGDCVPLIKATLAVYVSVYILLTVFFPFSFFIATGRDFNKSNQHAETNEFIFCSYFFHLESWCIISRWREKIYCGKKVSVNLKKNTHLHKKT